jgi:hypothetical protein
VAVAVAVVVVAAAVVVVVVVQVVSAVLAVAAATAAAHAGRLQYRHPCRRKDCSVVTGTRQNCRFVRIDGASSTHTKSSDAIHCANIFTHMLMRASTPPDDGRPSLRTIVHTNTQVAPRARAEETQLVRTAAARPSW